MPRRRLRRSAAAVALAGVLAVGGFVGSSLSTPGRSSAATRAVPILMYHHVSAAPAGTAKARLWVSARRFRQQVDALARAGYRPVTLAQVWRAWHGAGTLPPRPVVLSFDDGFVSQYRTAARVLRARRWPGVLFLDHQRLDVAGGLSRAQVRRMISDGWELGAHTLTHPDLTTVGADRLRDEVGGSREALRREFGVPVRAFAYPYGRVNDAVAQAARDAGFVLATTIRPGLASPDDDPYRLDRLLVDGRSPAALLRILRLRGATATSGPSRSR